MQELSNRIKELEEEKVSIQEKYEAEVSRLKAEVSMLRKALFGTKSEKSSSSQASDDLSQDLFGETEPATQEEIKEDSKPPKKDRQRGKRRDFPKNLERRAKTHDVSPEEKICPCCKEEMVRIGEDTSEQLDIIPALVYILSHRRPKYACPKCREGKVVQAPMPSQPSGMLAVGMLTYLIVGKYADHLPLCRTERILKRHGVELPRMRMCDALMRCGELLTPLVELMRERLNRNYLIQVDETSFKLQRSERERGFLFAYTGHGEAPYVVYRFEQGRDASLPQEHLKGFQGILQSDGLAVYKKLARITEGITPAVCWVHARRKFVEAQDSDDRAGPFIDQIRKLYIVEKKVSKAESDEEKLRIRKEHSKPVLEQLHAMLSDTMDILPGSALGKAIDYTLERWEVLTIVLRDSRVPLDNNASERALRAPVLGRKNWLVFGSERGGEMATVFFTLIASAQRAEKNPFEYIRFLLENISAWPTDRLEELLPDRWTPPTL